MDLLSPKNRRVEKDYGMISLPRLSLHRRKKKNDTGTLFPLSFYRPRKESFCLFIPWFPPPSSEVGSGGIFLLFFEELWT